MVHQIPNLFITFYISFKLVFLNREKTSPNTLACSFTETGLCQESSRTENYGGNPLVSTELWQNLKKLDFWYNFTQVLPSSSCMLQYFATVQLYFATIFYWNRKETCFATLRYDCFTLTNYLAVQIQQQRHYKKVQNMSKVTRIKTLEWRLRWSFCENCWRQKSATIFAKRSKAVNYFRKKFHFRLLWTDKFWLRLIPLCLR